MYHERKRDKIEVDNEAVVLRNQMIKHGVLTPTERTDFMMHIRGIEAQYNEDLWESSANKKRQIMVSKGISSRRRSIIIKLLEEHLNPHELAKLERIAYFCMLNDERVEDLNVNVSLKIK
jgi:hypothetical protein